MAGTIQIRGSAKEITPELRDLVVDTLCSLHDKGRYEDVALVLNKLDLSFSNARAIISMTNARPGTYEYHCATNAKMAMCFAEMGAVAVPTPPQTARC